MYKRQGKLYVYAGAIVVGTLIQVLLPVPWLRGRDGRLRVAIDWRDPAVKQVFLLMGPVTLGLGLINFNQVIGTFFASRYIDPTLAPAAIDAAFRIYMLPQGVFSVAVATVLFPRLAQLSARGDLDGFARWIGIGMRQIAFLLVPASVFSAVLAVPIVRLLYERGEFTADETPVVAAALAAFSLGLAFNGMMLMLNRGFFGLQAPWTPTAVALGNLVLNVVLYALLHPLGTWSIPLAISIANIAGTLALAFLLRRRIGRIGFGELAGALGRVTVASAALGAVAFGTWYGLDELLGRSLGAQALALLAALVTGGVAYLAVARLLGVAETAALHSLLGRFRKA